MKKATRIKRLRADVCVPGTNKVRGFHGKCPAQRSPGFGSSYDALYLDDEGRICCSECGTVDLATKRLVEEGLVV
jgi:hypothetical protein